MTIDERFAEWLRRPDIQILLTLIPSDPPALREMFMSAMSVAFSGGMVAGAQAVDEVLTRASLPAQDVLSPAKVH